jgi:hypothetical protein
MQPCTVRGSWTVPLAMAGLGRVDRSIRWDAMHGILGLRRWGWLGVGQTFLIVHRHFTLGPKAIRGPVFHARGLANARSAQPEQTSRYRDGTLSLHESLKGCLYSEIQMRRLYCRNDSDQVRSMRTPERNLLPMNRPRRRRQSDFASPFFSGALQQVTPSPSPKRTRGHRFGLCVMCALGTHAWLACVVLGEMPCPTRQGYYPSVVTPAIG